MKNYENIRRPKSTSVNRDEEIIGLSLRSLNAVPAGTTDTGVTYWEGASEELLGCVSGNPFTIVHSAADGSHVEITRSGYYEVQFSAEVVADAGATFGIALDPEGAELLAGALVINLTRVRSAVVAINGTGNAHRLETVATLEVNEALASTPGAGLVKILAAGQTLAGVFTPLAAEVLPATASWTLRRVGSLYA